MALFAFFMPVGVDAYRPLLTSYLYAPGIFVPPLVVGRYTHFYIDRAGIIVLSSRGGDIFGDQSAITGVEFAEINSVPDRSSLKQMVLMPMFNAILRNKFGIALHRPLLSADGAGTYDIDFAQINIGQRADVRAVQYGFERHCDRYHDTQIVVFGDSRGAVSVFNWIAEYTPHIACCICEAIFDDIPHMFLHFSYLGFSSERLGRLIEASLCAVSSAYKRTGPFPIDLVDRVPHSLPLLLVTSLTDRIVSCKTTMRLYCALRNRGYDKVHLLVLLNSEHDSYMVGPDKDMYEAIVHAFYRHYGIAEYSNEKACAGHDYFLATQPAVHEIIVQYGLSQHCCRV